MRRRIRVLVVVYDSVKGYLIFKLNLKHIFSDKPDRSDDEARCCFPLPVASFMPAKRCEFADFAAAGANIVAVTSTARTVVYDLDSSSVSPGPDLRAVKRLPVLLPVGDGTFFAMDLRPSNPGTNFESLRLPSAWRALPELPGPRSGLMTSGIAKVTAYFVAGTRVWVSLLGMGTFSFDMARRQWRTEGSWLLPVRGRAILAPDLAGGHLLFGFCSWDLHFCACDMEARPPVVRVLWEDVYPKEWCEMNEYRLDSYLADLAYFGGGRFCISRHIVVEDGTEEQAQHRALCIMAVEVATNLNLLKRRFRFYLMEQGGGIAHFL